MRPCSRSHASMRDEASRKSGLLLDVGRDVDHARRTDELAHRNRVARVVRQIAARDPVDRRVEVRAGVLAEAQRVPVPRRPPLVVARDDVDRDAGRRPEHRRQADDRRLGPERLRQIDDLQPARGQIVDELRQRGRHRASPTRPLSGGPQVALKLKPVLEQREARHVARRAHRVDLRDDRREIARGVRRGKLPGELVDRPDRRRARHAGGRRDRRRDRCRWTSRSEIRRPRAGSRCRTRRGRDCAADTARASSARRDS